MDPQQQQAANALAGIGGGILLFFGILIVAVIAFVIFLLWRIFTKAGLSGALSLLIFVPGFGTLIVLCILAFAEWKVVPVTQSYAGLPPAYPPAPSYPSPYQAQPTHPAMTSYPPNEPPPPTTPL